MVSTPPHKMAQPRSSSRGSKGHLSWVHGSPRSHSKRAAAAKISDGACSPNSGANSPQFLNVPMGNLASMSDVFVTPKHKEAFADHSGSVKQQKRMQANL